MIAELESESTKKLPYSGISRTSELIKPTPDVARRGRRRARRFIGLKRLKRLKRLKEFKVERVKGKVAERGGGGVNAE